MLPRNREPELMDTAEDASEYDAMDHRVVNVQFVIDLLAAVTEWSPGGWGRETASPQQCTINILDLGAGTAQIPIELARRGPNVHITAIDAAQSMLTVAQQNVDQAAMGGRINLVLADAKQLPFNDAAFPVVISNSIAHHIADPQTVLAEAIRVTAPGGLLFHRDLARPNDESELQQLVKTYASDATPHQRKLFADSLRAALTLDEIRDLLVRLGFARASVLLTSDRHWTWIATAT